MTPSIDLVCCCLDHWTLSILSLVMDKIECQLDQVYNYLSDKVSGIHLKEFLDGTKWGGKTHPKQGWSFEVSIYGSLLLTADECDWLPPAPPSRVDCTLEL